MSQQTSTVTGTRRVRRPDRAVPAASCWRTATGCWARSTTPRTWCRRPTCGPGGPTAGSRAGRRCGPGCTGSPPTRCLTAPAATVPPGAAVRPGARPTPDAAPTGRRRGPWLQPVPDALVTAESAGPGGHRRVPGQPAAGPDRRLQYLPARQRAVLILRDVLAFPAARSRGCSAPPRWRSTARCSAPGPGSARRPRPGEVAEPAEPAARALLDQYVAAFENADAAALERLLRPDAVLEMPPSLGLVLRPARPSPPLVASVLGSPGVLADGPDSPPTASPPRRPTSATRTLSTGPSGSWCSTSAPPASTGSWYSWNRDCSAGSACRWSGADTPVRPAPSGHHSYIAPVQDVPRRGFVRLAGLLGPGPAEADG